MEDWILNICIKKIKRVTVTYLEKNNVKICSTLGLLENAAQTGKTTKN